MALPAEAKVPKDLLTRINTGREHLQTTAPQRDECYEFYRGNQYAYVDDRGKLQFLATQTNARGAGKPSWRERKSRNLILDVVLRAKALATQRVPSYQVVPSTPDPDDVSAAHLSEKVLIYGHDRWRVRDAFGDAVVHAFVGGEAFIWPYFDNTIGPFAEGEDGPVGMGDIRLAVYGGNECYWQPGLRFDRSPWHVVEKAQPVEEVKNMPGFLGGEVTEDAKTRQLSFKGRDQGDKPDLVVVTHYLERPCPKYPNGRWITLANQRRILPDRDYPSDGQEPVLRRLAYAEDPDADRAISLVAQLIDAQRIRNDADNRSVEWMKLCLMPRIVVPPGLMKKQRWSDEPGKVYEIPQPEQNFKVVDTPQVPKELFEISDRATADIGRIAAMNDIPSQVEAGKAIEALLDNDRSRLSDFLGTMADVYGQVGRDCLVLVQRHYSEPRLLHIRGDFGWESIKDFRGSQLRDQIDSRVFAASIEPQTKEALEQRVMNYAQLGWLGAEDAMTAIETGTTERVLRSLAQDEARIGRVIQRIKEGPDSLYSMPNLPSGQMIPDETGQLVPEMVPGWMPRKTDNLAVWRVFLSDWMKSEEFERLDPELQTAAAQIFSGVQMLEAQQQEEQMQAMTAQAEQAGMTNASKPQMASGGAPKPAASLPSLNGSPDDAP